jgi:hypothetical protein
MPLLCPNFEECKQGALKDLGHIAKFRQKAEAMATCLVETEEEMLVCRSIHGFIGPEYAPGYWAGVGREEEQERPSWARVVSLPRERALLERRLALVSDLVRRMMEESGEPVPILLIPESME